MDKSPSDRKTSDRVIHQLDAHHRFFISIVAFLVALVVLHGRAAFSTQLVAAWDVFALVTIALATVMMALQDPYQVRRMAKLQDSNRTFLFITVVTAASMSLIAVFLLMGSSKNLPPFQLAWHTGLSFGAIVLSWTLVHTLFALRYAHFYYLEANQRARQEIEGGLDFPGEESPDYFDFAYFSFVIGMTCQVSDVQVTSKGMRCLCLAHGLIAFVFNTAILAMFVNLVAGLI